MGRQLVEEDALLFEFEGVLGEPQGLLPKRACDHALCLIKGAQLANVCPYRYPHYQKNKIEKIVCEMLIVGIIHPNVSPFSSLVILVRKK